VKHRLLFTLMALVVIFTMALSACVPAATPAPEQPTQPPAPAQPTAAPVQPTAAPAQPTAAPVQPTAAPAFTGLKLAAPDCSYGGEFKSIEAVDATTVKFTLCAPDIAFPAKVAFASNEILPKALLDSTQGDAAKISDNPIGTGPYVVKEWVRGDHMTLEANPNYWGTPPTLKTLILKWSKEPAQRLLELQSGNADGIDNPGLNDYATISSDPNLKLYPRLVNNVMYFAMNNTFKPFDKEEVRQAFAMAIDKQRIVKNFFPEGSAVAEQFVPPTLKPGYTDGFTWYPYDTAKAKQMLTDAGFDFNQTITFSYRNVSRSYVPQPDKVAQDFQAQMAALGIKVKLDVEESGTLLDNVKAGKLQMFLLGWGEDYPDPTDWYDYHFSADHKDFGNPYPDLVAAIKTGATTVDPAARQKAYDEVNALVKQHVPVIPISHSASAVGFKATVGNVIIGPYNENFQNMTTDSSQLVFIQNAEPISMYCSDQEDGETIRACMQVFNSLLAYDVGKAAVVNGLSDKYEANTDLTEWTFHLRNGVKFSDGSPVTANDVVASYTAQWDMKDPNHKGSTGTFQYFSGLFGGFLNAPPK
jgi:peptide/nickel transport system substrate-binding protein